MVLLLTALTGAAVISGALPLYDSYDRRRAHAAWLSRAVVDTCIEHEVAIGTIGAHEVAQRAAANGDRFCQYLSHRCGQGFITQTTNAAGRTLRINACAKQTFGRVDIPDTDHHVAGE